MCGRRQEASAPSPIFSTLPLWSLWVWLLLLKNLILSGNQKDMCNVILWGIQDERIGTATLKEMKRTNRKGCRALKNYILIAARLLSRNSRNTTIFMFMLVPKRSLAHCEVFVCEFHHFLKPNSSWSIFTRIAWLKPLLRCMQLSLCCPGRSESPPHQTHGRKESIRSITYK